MPLLNPNFLLPRYHVESNDFAHGSATSYDLYHHRMESYDPMDLGCFFQHNNQA